ncbi:MAG: succinate dehydrogenase/fumarate reductase flavoprotein subunit, partial [Nitrospinota bacterium]|nr:succinate dehydrogenase/fumarate reductase flavoprotein subunit [Nitrospinota bacterium]
KKMREVTLDAKWAPVNESREISAARREIDEVLHNKGTENLASIREDLQATMTDKVGVYRGKDEMEAAHEKIRELQDRFRNVKVDNKKGVFNTNLTEALELGHMLEYSELIVAGAQTREESRGAHARNDFPDRDDGNWMKHTMAFRTEDGGYELKYRPVRVTRFQPEERKY